MSRQGNSLELPPLSTLEDIILKHLENGGQVIILYDIFVSKCKESSDNILQAWRMDLTENITEEEWTEVCSLVQTQTVNTHSKLLLYKWLCRQYITPAR